MKITIKSYEHEYSVDMPDGSTLEEFMEEVKSLTKCVYSSQLVDDYWE